MPKTTPLMTPTIHMGGTNADVLLAEINAVQQAASALRMALHGLTLNGRDFVNNTEGYEASCETFGAALEDARRVEEACRAAKHHITMQMRAK